MRDWAWGLGFKGSRPDRVSGFGFQIRDPGIEAAVEWSRPWCRNPAVVLSIKRGSGMLDRGPGSWVRTWVGRPRPG